MIMERGPIEPEALRERRDPDGGCSEDHVSILRTAVFGTWMSWYQMTRTETISDSYHPRVAEALAIITMGFTRH